MSDQVRFVGPDFSSFSLATSQNASCGAHKQGGRMDPERDQRPELRPLGRAGESSSHGTPIKAASSPMAPRLEKLPLPLLSALGFSYYSVY